MQIYLAGGESRHYCIDRHAERERERMQLYLAGVAPWRESKLYDSEIKEHRPYILESFYYVNSDTERLLPYYGDFLLDSGAFTFMQNTKSKIDWEEYIRKFAEFINKHNVKKFLN